MKRVLIAMTLLLTACTTSTDTKSIESFAPCSQIQTVTSSQSPVMVECLESKSTVDIAAIKGPAVITAWASWCANCETQRPNFIRLYEESAGRLQVIGLDVEEKSKLDGFNHALARAMSYPHLYDPGALTVPLFGPGVPITRFIDANNQLAYLAVGPILRYDELKALVKKHLGIEI